MRKTTALLALAATAAFGFVGPALANGDANHGPKGYNDGQTDAAQQCNDADHTIAYVGPTRLWPPNHRDVEGAVTATDSATGHPAFDLTVVGKDNDTNQDSDFGGGTAASSNGTATTPVHFVRERTGTAKEGRTYTIKATATFDGGTNTCTKYFCVIVPHDMREANRTAGCTPEQF